MANWSRLATDPEIRALWESPQMTALKAQLQRACTEFKVSAAAGPLRVAHHQGILEGLKIAEEFAAKQHEMELKRAEEPEEEAVKNLRQFRGLRFAG